MLFFLSLDQAETETVFIAPYHYCYLVMILSRRILESCELYITTIIVNIHPS